MAISPPLFQSLLSQPMTSNNFIAVQSAKLAVTASTASITFTDLPGTLRVTAKITNSGTKGCYLASGKTTATAVVSSSTPSPAAGVGVVSNCDYIAAGSILTQDFIPGTDTFAAICAAADSTTLEFSIGYGQ